MRISCCNYFSNAAIPLRISSVAAATRKRGTWVQATYRAGSIRGKLPVQKLSLWEENLQ
jgi:hypothetical protein